jgi:integrase
VAKPRAKANGEGTLYYDKARARWVGQKYVRTLDGRTKRITARARTKANAMDALRAREREVAGISAGALHTTVETYLLAWLEHKSATVKARTHRDYKQVITDHVIPGIGAFAMAKLRPYHVQRVIDDLARAGKRTTAFNCRRYLKQAFAQAVEWEYLARNPVLGVARVDVPAPQRGLWTLEQITRFLVFTRSRTRYHALFLTAIVTGLRQGELVALPWANVTPDSVRVDRTWSQDEVEGYDTPKTRRAYRTVPISADVFAEIERARAGATSELAFPSAVGTMLSPYNVHRAFVDAADAAGVPRIRFHDTRRIAATLWARQGAEPKVIQQLLGHSTPHLALSVYQGVLDERVGAARLDAWMLFGGYAVFPGGQSRAAGDATRVVPERVTN